MRMKTNLNAAGDAPMTIVMSREAIGRPNRYPSFPLCYAKYVINIHLFTHVWKCTTTLHHSISGGYAKRSKPKLSYNASDIRRSYFWNQSGNSR